MVSLEFEQIRDKTLVSIDRLKELFKFDLDDLAVYVIKNEIELLSHRLKKLKEYLEKITSDV